MAKSWSLRAQAAASARTLASTRGTEIIVYLYYSISMVPMIKLKIHNYAIGRYCAVLKVSKVGLSSI